MYGGVHVIHSLIFETLVDIQNEIFGEKIVDLLWSCHNETQTRNEARNNYFIVVLGAPMCMHYMKFVGVYHIVPPTVWLFYFIKNKTKNMFFHLDSSLGTLGHGSLA